MRAGRGRTVSSAACSLAWLPERGGEAVPCLGRDVLDGGFAVGGVADQDAAAGGVAGLYAFAAVVAAVAGLAPGGDLHAVAAVVTAVAALAPGGADHAIHCSLATFAIRSREAAFGSASLLSASKRSPTSVTPAASSAIRPPETSSMNTILCSAGNSAMINAPSSPL